MRLCIIVLCISVAAFFSAAQAKTMFVTDTCTINVRVQPGEEYRIMDQLAADETVDVLETQDKWARISFKGGLEGWMLAQYVTAEKPKSMRIADLEKQLQDQAARMNELEPKDKAIVLYCASGARSGQAARFLKQAGFKDVVNAGGLDDMPQ